jgi:hypothetical protein
MVEEITSTYVVVKLWDLRRMIVPLTYFIEKPFQNWTRETSALVGNVMIYVDCAAPVGVIREKFQEILKKSDKWDGKTAALQVTDVKEGMMELRCLMSARSAGQTFDLRCEVREKLIDFQQREHPEALPRSRQISFEGDAKSEEIPVSQAQPIEGGNPRGCVCAMVAAILPRNSAALAPESPSIWPAKTVNSNDSAGIKGGLLAGPPFFVAQRARWRRTDGHARRVKFTGVGYVVAHRLAWRLRRKTLTCFRESETPVVQPADFSPLCPPSYPRRVSPAARAEVPFLRHFFVMSKGIKT